MYACICSAVSYEEIQLLISKGYSIEEVYKLLKVGENCKICIKDLASKSDQ